MWEVGGGLRHCVLGVLGFVDFVVPPEDESGRLLQSS